MQFPVIARFRSYRSVRVALIVLGCFVLFSATWFSLAVITLPEVGHFDRQRPKTTAYMQDYVEKNPGRPLFCAWVDYEDISPHLKRAILVSEDINFFAHNGFDGHEIGQALTSLSQGELGSEVRTRYEERFQIPLLLGWIALLADTVVGDRRRRNDAPGRETPR